MKEDNSKGWYKSNYLPHCDYCEIYQFVTFRLYDSVPKKTLELWKAELKLVGRTSNESIKTMELQKRISKYEKNGYGKCFLKDKRIAKLVENALKYFDRKRYDLIEWCIMPNHVHVLLRIFKGNRLPDIIHSWKSFTAKEANKILAREGKFWMREYFDKYIRDENHFKAVVEYIRNNGKQKPNK